MNKVLAGKVHDTIAHLRAIWPRLEGKYPFIAFSTGKDSLAMAALIYEAVEPAKPICIYSHHDLEFASNLEYLKSLVGRGFFVKTVRPFLEYFELMERGISFLTLLEAWCIPLLVGTTFLEHLQQQGARTPEAGVMFRGISGSEYSHRFHGWLEKNQTLGLPCFNPMLKFSKAEILELLKSRYGLPLNPIYRHMDRTYCVCCYTSDAKRQKYLKEHYPEECKRYYGQIEKLIFESGLIEKLPQKQAFKTRQEKLDKHGFAHWHRLKPQNVVGAIKHRFPSGALSYQIRDPTWIETKHLEPVRGRWTRKANELRFWDVPERTCDSLIKRMINCLDCGFCIRECFSARKFDRQTKRLNIEGCIQCGGCLGVKHCMGWRHRFWRRIVTEETR